MASKSYVEVPCVLLSLVKETSTGDDIEMTVQMSAEAAANAINTALALVKAWKENQPPVVTYRDKILNLKFDDLEEALKATGLFAAFRKKMQIEDYE